MEIILLENINKLGKIGDQVKVKNGYGRNYLLRQGKALRASKENIELVDKKKEKINKKNNKIKSEFLEIAKKINNKILKFKKESKDNGDLFGTIKPKEISNAFTNELRIQITPSQINLKKEIDKIGDYKIEINLYSEVSTTVTIKVQKIEAK